MEMKKHNQIGKKPGAPAYRTPSWFKNAPGKNKGFRPPFRRPSI